MTDLTIKNRDLYAALKNRASRKTLQPTSSESKHFVFEYIRNKLSDYWDSDDEEFKTSLKNKVKGYCSTLDQKWKKCNRTASHFISYNNSWLDHDFNLNIPQNRDISQPSTTSRRRGRPTKDFGESSDRSKRRKIEDLISSRTSDELLYATKSVLYTSGKHAAADLLSQTVEYSPERPIKLRKIIRDHQGETTMITPYSEDEALAYFINSRMSKNSYQQTRLGAKKRGVDIYPSYTRIRMAKQRCYPGGIVVDQFGASVPLQNLLNHTSERICELSNNFPEADSYSKLELICKWGCDGSSGHSEYMQNFNDSSLNEEENTNDASDGSLFLISLVPLRLVGHSTINDEKYILWKNPTPSSTRYCRPIKFKHLKETTEVIISEVRHIEKEISALEPFEILINGKTLQIHFSLILTMIDGKVINALTGTSSQTCYICKCKPTNMNVLDKLPEFEVNEDNLKYGLSTLHAWIKCLECILHISYKLNTCTTKRLTKIQKDEVAERKRTIQKRFWKEMGLKVDKVTQGSGTSNTGNVARRFFKNSEKTAQITGVNVNLIRNLSIILSVISSGRKINFTKFDRFAMDTAKLYVQLYSWYRMPPSVHKILVHGSIVIQYALLPIGVLSEEAQEGRNKDFKRYREHHTRKSSRINTNLDLMNMLLISSDPKITANSSLPKTPKTQLPYEALDLLESSESDGD